MVLLKFDFKEENQPEPGLRQNKLWEEIISREVKLVNWAEGGRAMAGQANLQKVELRAGADLANILSAEC